MPVIKGSIKSKWEQSQNVEEWAKRTVRKWNHDQKVAVLKELARLTEEEHAARLQAREEK